MKKRTIPFIRINKKEESPPTSMSSYKTKYKTNKAISYTGKVYYTKTQSKNNETVLSP